MSKLAAPQRENWREVIPQSDANLEGVAVSGGKIIVQYTLNAASQLRMVDAEGKSSAALPLPSLGSVSGLAGRWKSPELFFRFESYSTPATVYRYQVEQGNLSKWAGSDSTSGSAEYEVEQVWFTSKDKTRVPMFLYHKKGIRLDGNSPVLMTGYGGFDVSETPSYWVLGQYWVEQGGIFVDVNLRGGAEFGEDWHHAGMLGKKQNVFDDFAAAAEFLIRQHYTSAQKLAITGTSNGGLLVGASLTQRPELFRAVICGYPLLDMLRFHKFMDGSYWVPEYGSAENLEQFEYLYKYSPYHNVKEGVKYPAVLFVTGDGDTRVAPLHARKMAARLQAAAANGSDRPILLLYDTKSGHSGGPPVSKQVEENTDILSFLWSQIGATAAEHTSQ
jgi:prolyl oligopeptidase